MEFDLTFLDTMSASTLQEAIDGVNAEFKYDSGVWNFVSNGGLLEAHRAPYKQRRPFWLHSAVDHNKPN